MPLLPTFDELWRAGKESDLLFGIILYTSFKNRQEKESQKRILPLLRQQFFSCILHSPRNMYDILSLAIAALHLPLLLGTLSDGRNLDGLGLLSSAASAARAHEINSAFARLSSQQASSTPAIYQSSQDTQHACLWMLLCLYSAFAALAGNVDRQPLVGCSWGDVEALEAYSETAWSLRETSIALQRQNASILLLVFRMRATMKMREMCRKYVCLLMNHKDDVDHARNRTALQRIIKEAIDALQSWFEELTEDRQRTALRLGTLGRLWDRT